MTTTHRPRWRVRKYGARWYIERRHARHWAVWSMHCTHARALAQAVAEAHRMSRS